MSRYHAAITEATGVTNPKALEWIEDHMRHVIFHSTLDWQSRTQLRGAALKAQRDLKYLASPAGQAEFPDLAEDVKAIGSF